MFSNLLSFRNSVPDYSTPVHLFVPSHKYITGSQILVYDFEELKTFAQTSSIIQAEGNEWL